MVRALLAGSASQEVGGVEPDALAAAGALLADGPVTVVLGRANLAESADGVVAAAAAIHAAHPDVRFLSALRRGNVHGALDMGLAPGLLPGPHLARRRPRVVQATGWPKVPAERGLDATGILQAAAGGKVDVLVLLGADPLADFPDTDLADPSRRRRSHRDRRRPVPHRLRPAGRRRPRGQRPAETDGTTTNLEGRISTVTRKITPPGTARDDWMLAAELARLLGADLGVESAAQILEEIARSPQPPRPQPRCDPGAAMGRRRRPLAGPRRRPEGWRSPRPPGPDAGVDAGRRRHGGDRRGRRRAAGRRGRGHRGPGRCAGAPTEPRSPPPPPAPAPRS